MYPHGLPFLGIYDKGKSVLSGTLTHRLRSRKNYHQAVSSRAAAHLAASQDSVLRSCGQPRRRQACFVDSYVAGDGFFHAVDLLIANTTIATTTRNAATLTMYKGASTANASSEFPSE